MAKRRALNIVFIGLTIGAGYTIGAAGQMDTRYRIDREDNQVYLVDSQRGDRLLLDENQSIATLARCDEERALGTIEYQVEDFVDRFRNLYDGLVE